MFYFAVFFGDICQLLDQCSLSQLVMLQNVEWPEVHEPLPPPTPPPPLFLPPPPPPPARPVGNFSDVCCRAPGPLSL
jgi:hypothetical protein